MSIIEDAENLSPKGKYLCGLTFGLGVVWLLTATSLIGAWPREMRKEWEKTKTSQSLPSQPEDVSSPHGGIPPKTTQEQTRRQEAIKGILERLALELEGQTNPQDPKAILVTAAQKGAIHPLDAKNSLVEASVLGIETLIEPTQQEP
jgi:hypothetical protein